MEQVQADRVRWITRSKIHDVIGSPRGNKIEKFLSEVAMHIDETDASACFDVLHKKVAQKCGLPGTRLSDTVKVLTPIVGRQSEKLASAPDASLANEVALLFNVNVPGHTPAHSQDTDTKDWKVSVRHGTSFFEELRE